METPERALSLVNRCGESQSPYVRSHIDNPTAWQLWSPETLELARKTNRLLFVSIGYSACHWCHVMAHESFDDPRVAQLLNENFIPVKIDREERPDIDRQYMDFVQATTGGGGWPLNVFVTPELEPIFGGTYWPGPKSERAQAGGSFDQILLRVAQSWKEQEKRCRDTAKDIVRQLRDFAQEGNLGGRDGKGDEEDSLELDLLDDAYEHYKKRFDPKYGGFGASPKFPTPVHIRPLLRVGAYPTIVREIVGEEECVEARTMAVKSLQAMAKGGIKDQVGHGFARYSVTRDWSLPHFEKMLYDNAQLLPVYLDAYLLTKSTLFLDMVNDIAAYLTSPPMASSVGGIHSAEDADSAPTAKDEHKREGAFYVWTYDELKSLLTEDELAVSTRYWNVQPNGNVDRRFDHQGELVGQNTLCVQCSTSELAKEVSKPEEQVVALIQSSRKKLLSYRDQNRPRPALDDKIVTSWNGLALGGLARAASALRKTHPTESSIYLAAAQKAATFIRENLFNASTKTLLRIYRSQPGSTPGFADDYAFLISGLIDLYEATFNPTYLHFAATLQETQTSLFWDTDKYGFFSTPANQPDILIRTKDAMDNAEPSVNGISAANLFRLSSLLNDADFEKQAKRTVAAFDVEIQQHPGLFSSMLSSVVASKMGMRGIMIVGGDTDVSEAVLGKMRETVRPNTTLLRVGGDDGGDEEEKAWLRQRNDLLRDLPQGKNMVQVCEGGVCKLLESVEDVEKAFAQ